MKELEKYLNETLGVPTSIHAISVNWMNNLPLYLRDGYILSEVTLFGNSILFAQPKDWQEWKLESLRKNMEALSTSFNKKVVLMLPEVNAINRKRLIDHQINFVVPGRQLFLPELLIDFQERFPNTRPRSKARHLLPSAQFLLIYHIIHRFDKWQIEDKSLKEIAIRTGYSAVAIRKAVDDLVFHELATLEGTKEKYLRFHSDRHELWNRAEEENLLISPVLKTVYVDMLPKKPFMLKCNASAMPEYSDLNPSRISHFAIEKDAFYRIEKENGWHHLNSVDGVYCLEVWKYNPIKLVDTMPNDDSVVDPLSLYLSLKSTQDERIEMGLEQIIEKFIW